MGPGRRGSSRLHPTSPRRARPVDYGIKSLLWSGVAGHSKNYQRPAAATTCCTRYAEGLCQAKRVDCAVRMVRMLLSALPLRAGPQRTDMADPRVSSPSYADGVLAFLSGSLVLVSATECVDSAYCRSFQVPVSAVAELGKSTLSRARC